MENLIHDIRYGLRMLRKSPGFAAVAIITLALGIGANTAIFSIVNAVLLRPLPYYQPDQLMSVAQISVRAERAEPDGSSVSYPDFFDWRSGNHSFESMASYYDNEFTLTGAGRPLHMEGEIVSSDFFSVLGVSPFLGRGFRREEEKPGARVAVLSHEIWESVFGSDQNILGRNITLNSRSYQVVGVMPANFAFPIQTTPPKLWVTLGVDAEVQPEGHPMTEQRGAHFLSVIGRLKPDVPLSQAQQDMNLIAQSLAKQYPATNVNMGAVNVTSELESLVGRTRRPLILLLGAVGCVLLIACANVANLLLARAGKRSRELAVRTAVGASRRRVIGQLFTESLVLAAAGAALGIPLAAWGIKFFLHLNVPSISRIQTTALDGYVLAFTAAVTVLTSFIFGLAPAFRSSDLNLVESLKEGGRGVGTGVAHQRLRNWLVIAETAIGLVLLVFAGLFLRTFQHLLRVDPGFNPNQVLTLNFELPEAKYPSAQQVLFYDQLLPRLRNLPGVAAVAGVFPLPMSDNRMVIGFDIDGRPTSRADRAAADLRMTSPGYFQMMGIPLLSGRDFSERDDRKANGVVIVNQAFARKYFPNEDPIGKHMKPGIGGGGPPVMREIVGVVGDIKQQRLDAKFAPEMYIPYAQVTMPLALCVRTRASDPLGVASEIKSEIASMDPEVPVYDVRSFEDYVSDSVAQQRFHAFLFGMFGLLALLLTAIGLYGVMAYTVAQRTHEIGVRMTLGATGSTVLQMILKSAFLLTGIGLLIGIAMALVVTRFLSSMLFGVRPLDLITFGAVTAVLLAVSLLASYVPARRATKVDPMIALRYE